MKMVSCMFSFLASQLLDKNEKETAWQLKKEKKERLHIAVERIGSGCTIA
jgi:hypothetical protein